MNIRNVGHSMKYEAECVAMLFFPDEKIVTTEYPAGEIFPPQQEDYVENRLEDGVMHTTLFLNGETRSMQRRLYDNPQGPYEQDEFLMCDMMYTLLVQATGVHPAWGALTGVRPIKLFHRRLDAGKSPEETGREFAGHFHVSEEKIALALETAAHEAPILREATDDTCSLYVSIPFCPSRCSYCSFVSHDITSKRANKISKCLSNHPPYSFRFDRGGAVVLVDSRRPLDLPDSLRVALKGSAVAPALRRFHPWHSSAHTRTVAQRLGCFKF